MITNMIVTREAHYVTLEYGIDFLKSDTVAIQGKSGRRLTRSALERIGDDLGFDHYESAGVSTDKDPNISIILVMVTHGEGGDRLAVD